jgi:hypothetical protein
MGTIKFYMSMFFCVALIVGCGGSSDTTGGGDAVEPEPAAPLPVFSFAWSEHPGWSMFAVAQDRSLLNGDAGSTGTIEDRWGVDIELKKADYQQGITDFANGAVDAVCITNADSLAPSLKRPCVAILPTSKGAHGASESTAVADDTITMVVVGKDALSKPGGEDFAVALIDAFYEINYLLKENKERDIVLNQFSSRFGGDLSAAETIKQAQLYDSPEAGLKLFEDAAFQNETMPRVVTFCVDQSWVDSKPTIGFGDPSAQLNFDPAYIKKYQD